MSLKQSVVIVNEFTMKTANGGTRGGTPGEYVTRYMSRNGATEDLTPIRRDTEDFITRYMARASAVDKAESVGDLKDRMRSIQGMGGVAFGYGDFSLSDTKLKAAAKDIQKQFDSGKTVLKTVLSFDEEYLRKHNLVDPNFEFDHEGDYRGNIDQMKLRMAIMNGLDKLSRHYDDLQYVGVIQVDTKHVHCHLAMVDRGKGHLMPDGTQRGKLTDLEKNSIRRGIDSFLDEKQAVKMMTANVEQDRHNTVCFVKKYTHQLMSNQGFSQFLLACLPEDRNLWRAGSNRKEMQKPNAIVREYVNQLLEQPDSGYREALQKVDIYARSRTKEEDLTGEQYRTLYKKGHDRIIEQSMNSVYSVLKEIPPEELTVRTPMIDVMSMPYADMANEITTDPMIEFGFKLRSYKSRLDHHKNEMHKYHEAVVNYEKQEADETSRPLYDYFRIEEEYNAMLLAKYQYFLKFVPPDEEYLQDLDELTAYNQRIENLSRMKDDTTMLHMTPDNAERYGRRQYDETGGRYMVTDPGLLDNRLETMQLKYRQMRSDYMFKLRDYGFQLDDQNNIVHQIPYAFDDVKALDLHHLMYDFPYDLSVSNMNVDAFTNMADKRRSAFEKAKEYLENSGQGDMVAEFPQSDISLQASVADRFRTDGTLYSRRSGEKSQQKQSKTIRLDYESQAERELHIKEVIRDTINSLQYE